VKRKIRVPGEEGTGLLGEGVFAGWMAGGVLWWLEGDV
jgi:hypothetical protein